MVSSGKGRQGHCETPQKCLFLIACHSPFLSVHVQVEGGDTSAPSAKKPKQDMQPPSSSVAPPPPISADSADTSYKSTTAKSKRKRSKGKSRRGNEAPPTTSSGLPSDFFDSGVSKTFHGHGEEVYYESSSDSEEEGMEVKRPGKGTATSGLPSGMYVYT